MKIGKLKIEDIISVEIKKTHDSVEDFINDKSEEYEIELYIDATEFFEKIRENDFLDNIFHFENEVLKEAFDSNVYNFEGNNIIVSKNFKANSNKINEIKKILNEIHTGIKNCLIEEEKAYNENLIIEKENDLMYEYEDEIRILFINNLFEKINHDKLELKIISKSTSYPFSFFMDDGLINENERNTMSLERKSGSGSYLRDLELYKKEYDEIRESKVVSHFEFVQKNNPTWLRVYLNEYGKQLIKESLEYANKAHIENPRYKTPIEEEDDNFVFVGRVNDGVGHDADVWIDKESEITLFVNKDEEFTMMEKMKKENPAIYEKGIEVANKYIEEFGLKSGSKKRYKR